MASGTACRVGETKTQITELPASNVQACLPGASVAIVHATFDPSFVLDAIPCLSRAVPIEL